MTAHQPHPQLPFRVGCPLALLLGVALVAAVQWLAGQPYRPDEWGKHAWDAAWAGAPFAMLALAKARDWLAWTAGIVLNGVLLAYLAYDLSQHHGANMNFGLNLLLAFLPLAFAVACLSIAGMRGRIAWAHEGDDPPDPA
jgi:hypothetical protein